MKKALLFFGLGLLFLQTGVFAQRKCGAEQYKAAIIAKYPGAAQVFEARKASLQGIADDYKLSTSPGMAEKTTAVSPIPVIFHIVVSTTQLTQMGGYSGVAQRVDSQIAVLNRDYNRQNSDSVLIPSLWKPLYGNAGIHFGAAHTDPNGNGTPGYEIKTTTTLFTGGSGFTYSAAKYASSGGLDAWDVTKYLNVWCIYFSDASDLLGITVPKSDVVAGWNPAVEEGICITYLALGSQTAPTSLIFPSGGSFYKGRTLTHEIGHFFEIWHTWGDDGGFCPWSGGSDDGLADTPPEGDAHYGVPAYTITGGTINDACQFNGPTDMQPKGIACLDFMNYTDDVAMYLFTTDQVAVVAAKAAGESYSLSQHPNLLLWPPATSVANTSINNSLNIFPNPATGMFNITFDQVTDNLKQIMVMNMLGQEVQNINTAGQQKNYYSIDLSGMSKGIYFVRCNFASGSITRKILLQ